VTDAVLGVPFLCVRSSGLQEAVGSGDDEAALDPYEDETNGRAAELAKISMMQDCCEAACDITGGACERPRKNDVQLRPTPRLQLPDTDRFENGRGIRMIQLNWNDGNECVRKFERMTLVRQIEMNVMSDAAYANSSEKRQWRADEEHSQLQ
jgi:hypothetical protein